jgi:hypothetical protein
MAEKAQVEAESARAVALHTAGSKSAVLTPGAVSGLDRAGSMALQRAIGNRAMTQLARSPGARPAARPSARPTRQLARLIDACTCTDKTQYDDQTIAFIKSLRYDLNDYVNFRERLAVAGCIADEYNTQRGVRGALDATQDWLVGHAPSFWIGLQRWGGANNKVLNDMKNDLGPANINLGTAVEYVEKGWITIPGVDPKDIDYGKVVDFLQSRIGTIKMTAAVVRRAHTLFDPYNLKPGVDTETIDAVSVEYFKQGDGYYNRFKAARDADPDHMPCPGEGGCRFIANRQRLSDAVYAPR